MSSQFAPKRIFNPHNSSEVDSLHHTVNGHGSCVIANGTISPPATPSNDLEFPDHPDSPGIFRTQSYDAVLFDIRKVSAEKLAAQLTLIDLPLFKEIMIEEFSNCNWTRKEKHRLAPNIVAFTHRFNHTSFWVVREILSEENLRLRAEILTKFIKIAKKLFDLNNIHSLKAVVSGLQSSPIYRLAQTWKGVAKKDKTTFERLEDFLSDDDNRKNLREHMDAAKLPCIPFLGMYLTDLCFLHGLPNKCSQVETIYNMIAYCQNSSYDGLIIEPHIQKYLSHIRYIDELQKFFEDENYKLSLKHEPDQVSLKQLTTTPTHASNSTQQLRTSRSHEDLLAPFESDSQTTNSDSKVWTPQPNHRMRESRHSVCVTKGSNLLNGDVQSPRRELRDEFEHAVVVNNRTKVSTLPSNLKGPSNHVVPKLRFTNNRKYQSESCVKPGDEHHLQLESPCDGGDPFTPSLAVSQHRKVTGSSPSLRVKMARGHKKSHSLGTNLMSILGVGKHSPPQSSRDLSPEQVTRMHSRSLIDDSVLDNSHVSFGTYTPTGSTGNLSSCDDSSERSVDLEEEELYRKLDDVDELSADQLQLHLVSEGRLRRKVLKRNGKSVSQLSWGSNFWVRLTPVSLLLFTSKPNSSKRANKAPEVKGLLLKNCRVKYRDPTEKMSDKQFMLVDDKGNHTRFTAKSSSKAKEWVDNLREAIEEEEERERKEAERSLIKL